MANLKEIKNSIDSVKKTSKLTQAMKMVAAAKFKRATEEIQKASPYLESLEGIFDELSKRLESDFIPALMQKNTATRKAIIIIAGDRGLCGGFNNNLLKKVAQDLKGHEDTVDLYLFGNKACQYFKNKGFSIKAAEAFFVKTLSKDAVESAINTILSAYKNNEVGEVLLYYNLFKSALSNEITQKTLAPIEGNTENSSDNTEGASDFIYEPSRGVILDELTQDYIVIQLYQAFLSSIAGEEGSRMTAMDSATDNAKEMIGVLTLKYNRGRQAQITAELSEIVAGANALAG